MIRRNISMRRLILGFLFSAILIVSCNVKKVLAASYIDKNVFDIYTSTGQRLTKKNSGLTMNAISTDRRCGYIITPVKGVQLSLVPSKKEKISWTLRKNVNYWFYIPKMKNKGIVELYVYPPKPLPGYKPYGRGSGLFAKGILNMSKKGNNFGNIVSITNLGKYYFKWNAK